MTLDPRIVKESFAKIEPVAEEATAYFYARLFAENPPLRDLFPAAMDVQRDRLFGALTRIVASLDDRGSLAVFLGKLGRDHHKYGVRREHYDSMGRALLATLRKYSGDAWNPAVAAAWTAAYTTAAGMMASATEEKAATSPPSWIGEVVDHDLRTPDIAVVTVRPDQPLPYQPGQYLTIQTSRWQRLWRPYSIANAPGGDGLLRFHVRAVPGGCVSGALVRHTKAGDQIQLGPATGTMTLDRGSGRDLLCVAGGTGLAPLKAIIEQVVGLGQRRGIHLVFGARTRRELYDLSALRLLASGYPWLNIVPVASGEHDFRGQRGKACDVLGGLGTWTGHDVYVAGSTAMISATIARLRDLDVPRSQVRHDQAAYSEPASDQPVRGAARTSSDGAPVGG